jgi:hypothetical protein
MLPARWIPTLASVRWNECLYALEGGTLFGRGWYQPVGRECPSHIRRPRESSQRHRDVAFRVGLAGKSGVGGGILAVIPEVGTLAVWSPRLNEAGNSLAGTLAMEWFSKRTGVNLF